MNSTVAEVSRDIVDSEEDAVLDAPLVPENTAPHPHKRARLVKADDEDDAVEGVATKRSAASKQALAVAAQSQLAAIKKEQAAAQRSRLKFLLGQSEIFAHFIHNLDGPLTREPADGEVAPAASFSSPRTGSAGVGVEIGEALLLSPIRAAAAAQHRDSSEAMADVTMPSLGLSGAAPPSSKPVLSVRRTRSAVAERSAAVDTEPVPVEGKGRKRSRATKGMHLFSFGIRICLADNPSSSRCFFQGVRVAEEMMTSMATATKLQMASSLYDLQRVCNVNRHLSRALCATTS